VAVLHVADILVDLLLGLLVGDPVVDWLEGSLGVGNLGRCWNRLD
jgi:hypothetical protein